MNRLSTRFSLTMIGVSLVTLLLLISLQRLTVRPQAESLGQDLGVSVNELLASPLRSGAVATPDQLTTLQTQLDGLERGLQTAFTDRDNFYSAQRRTFLFSTGLALLFATSFGWFVGQWLARPVKRLAKTVTQVSSGNLSVRVPPLNSSRELADL